MADLLDIGCYSMLTGILLLMYANTLVNCFRRHPYESLPV